jgi:hypothetical protein
MCTQINGVSEKVAQFALLISFSLQLINVAETSLRSIPKNKTANVMIVMLATQTSQ